MNEPTSEKLDESFSGLPALFGITVYGGDLAAIHDAAGRIERAAGRVDGVSNVVNNTKIPVDQIVVRIDRDAGARLGVDARTVADAVRLAMQGEAVTDVVVEPAAGDRLPALRRRGAQFDRGAAAGAGAHPGRARRPARAARPDRADGRLPDDRARSTARAP